MLIKKLPLRISIDPNITIQTQHFPAPELVLLLICERSPFEDGMGDHL